MNQIVLFISLQAKCKRLMINIPLLWPHLKGDIRNKWKNIKISMGLGEITEIQYTFMFSDAYSFFALRQQNSEIQIQLFVNNIMLIR